MDKIFPPFGKPAGSRMRPYRCHSAGKVGYGAQLTSTCPGIWGTTDIHLSWREVCGSLGNSSGKHEW